MRLIKKLSDHLIRSPFGQEYLCLDRSQLDQHFRILCYAGNRFIADVTWSHVFTGYQPLLLSLPVLPGENHFPEIIQLAWLPTSLPINEMNWKKDALALLQLKKIAEQNFESLTIQHFEGFSATHKFQSTPDRIAFGVHNLLFNRKKGNVYLPNDLYRQVQLAYSIPRNIALITTGENDKFNLFPTDLHGPAGKGCYLDSLRAGGKALEQVRKTKKILLSLIDPTQYKQVYALGKNHMQPMKEIDQFSFSSKLSPVVKLPIPEGATQYWELELLQEFNRGIHQVLLFRILNEWEIGPGHAILAHIHSVYAEWRKKQGLAGNYFLR